jgi:hypothetical protein
MQRCHICASHDVVEMSDFRALQRVSSACLPLESGGSLLSCNNCGALVTDLSPEWHQLCSSVYENYEVYAQSGGHEELTYTHAGNAAPRSSRLLSLLVKDLVHLRGGWLDFGCGNGSFLREVSTVYPGVPLFGVEYSERQQESVLAIPGAQGFWTSLDSAELTNIGVLSMVHVLEHIENPRELLESLALRLPDDAQVFIQVPNVASNPYVLTVGDHATHFTSASLRHLIETSGLEVVWLLEDFVAGELSLLAHRTGRVSAPSRTGQSSFGRDSASASAAAHAALVETVVTTSQWLRTERRDFHLMGIFGTSVAGTWAGATVNFEHDFWVDEDPRRVGTKWLGIPVMSPDGVPTRGHVSVVLAPMKARRVASKLLAGKHDMSLSLPPNHYFVRA